MIRAGERPWKGISFLVLEEAGVTLNGALVRIPYRDTAGVAQAWRVFAGDGRCWWQPAGLELVPFGLETLPEPAASVERVLLLAEGESDALALREAFADVRGDSPVRGYHVLGIPGASSWRSSWRCWLEPFPVIYILGDGDPAGQALCAAVKRDVPWARPVWLPAGEDARSLLQRDGARALEPFFAEADAAVHLRAAFVLAGDIETAERLLRGEAVSRGA